MTREADFQAHLKHRLADLFPGCIILKNDANDLESFPDLTILYFDRWFVLETKSWAHASRRKNQAYYINLLRQMGGNVCYANFVSPETEERVINEIQEALRNRRTTRFSQRKQASLDRL